MWTLRQETEADWWAVEALYDLCFAPGREALSSYRLRDGVPPVAALSTVAVDEDGILGGAVRFWPVVIMGPDAGSDPSTNEDAHTVHSALLLGPIAVHPTRQGEGLGAGLMRETLARAHDLGWARILLVGDAPYYARFGFSKLHGVVMPPPTNPERVLGFGTWDGVSGVVTKAVQTGAVSQPSGESTCS